MDDIDDKNKNELQIKTDNFNEYIDQISVLLKSVSKVMEDFTNEFSRNVVPALKYLSEVLKANEINILNKLIKNNIVYWDVIDEKTINNLEKEDTINNILNLGDNINSQYFNCDIIINSSILNQSITSYYNEYYGSCVLGLFAIIDGMLSFFLRIKKKQTLFQEQKK